MLVAPDTLRFKGIPIKRTNMMGNVKKEVLKETLLFIKQELEKIIQLIGRLTDGDVDCRVADAPRNDARKVDGDKTDDKE